MLVDKVLAAAILLLSGVTVTGMMLPPMNPEALVWAVVNFSTYGFWLVTTFLACKILLRA